MKRVVAAAWITGWVLFPTSVSPSELDRVRELRLRGELPAARSLAEATLADASLGADARIELHLELARISDRVGLHQNSRPVAAALREIEAAARVVERPTRRQRARIELALAEYHYRAEMQEGQFTRATAHAQNAMALFEELGDARGQADAVHRLGLIHLQKRELDTARELFDRSLELEKAGDERLVFLADYERHVGFVLVLAGDTTAAVPSFERSLVLRRRAGAIDASLFAARTLGATLVEAGRLEEARAPLAYALLVAERLDSPVGRARVGLALGELYEKLGDDEAARLAFEVARHAGVSVDYRSAVEQATAGLERLNAAQDPGTDRPPIPSAGSAP